MKDLSPIRNFGTNRTKVHFHYQNSSTPTRINKQNHSNNTPLNVKQFPSHHIEEIIHQNNCMCGKKAFYRSVTNNNFFCAQCAIQPMIKGIQLVEQGGKIEHKRTRTQLPKQSKQPVIKVKKPSRELQLQQFLQDLSKQQNDLKMWLNNPSNQQIYVRQSYRAKRQQLKQHHEKILAAMRSSLEADMNMLNQFQKQQLVALNQTKNSRTKDINNLVGIKLDIKPNFKKIVEKVEEIKYQEFMEKYRSQLGRISSENIINFNSRVTVESSVCSKSVFYQPNFYRIYECNGVKKTSNPMAEHNILFSFEKRR